MFALLALATTAFAFNYRQVDCLTAPKGINGRIIGIPGNPSSCVVPPPVWGALYTVFFKDAETQKCYSTPAKFGEDCFGRDGDGCPDPENPSRWSLAHLQNDVCRDFVNAVGDEVSVACGHYSVYASLNAMTCQRTLLVLDAGKTEP